MDFALWYLIIGSLLVSVTLFIAHVRRLPITPTMLYLGVGMLLGPHAAGMIRVDALEWSLLLERLSEIAVVVSLFSTGLKLRSPLRKGRWLIPVRLAFISMAVTVGLITAVGVWLLNLPVGVAVLLGAVLAPTDPVLASEVQLATPWDRDRLRFSLTGEAGLNDGTAFPFVMLGLGLMNLHEIGAWGWRWFAIDVCWAVIGGLAIGAAVGRLVGMLVIYFRRIHRETSGLDELLSLGVMSLAYGAAIACWTYGFLAALTAGMALRRIEMSETEDRESSKDQGEDAHEVEASTDPSERASRAPKTEPAYMAWAVLTFNEQLERLLAIAMVLLLGGMLTTAYMPFEATYFVPLLLLVIRPIAVVIGLAGLGRRITSRQRGYMCWFGIRGIGSVYYLMYAINHGLDAPHAKLIIGLVLVASAVSITVHGISVTPLMKLYSRNENRETYST